MRSRIPKPLHRICGREMVRYPVELLKKAGAERVVVVVSPHNRKAIMAVLELLSVLSGRVEAGTR